MSIDILARYYEAFNDRNGGTMLALVTDDIMPEPSQGTERIGKAAFAEFLSRMNHCYDEKAIDPVFLLSEDGLSGAAEFMLRGRYLDEDDDFSPAYGQHCELRADIFLALRDGKIARISNHYNLVRWMAQVAG